MAWPRRYCLVVPSINSSCMRLANCLQPGCAQVLSSFVFLDTTGYKMSGYAGPMAHVMWLCPCYRIAV